MSAFLPLTSVGGYFLKATFNLNVIVCPPGVRYFVRNVVLMNMVLHWKHISTHGYDITYIAPGLVAVRYLTSYVDHNTPQYLRLRDVATVRPRLLMGCVLID